MQGLRAASTMHLQYLHVRLYPLTLCQQMHYVDPGHRALERLGHRALAILMHAPEDLYDTRRREIIQFQV